jgi:DNA-binding NarL/FixJ family response regulator
VPAQPRASRSTPPALWPGLSPVLQGRVLEVLAGQGDRGVASRGEERREPPDRLTVREAEVPALMAEGLSNTEIAARLQVSMATVKTHIDNLFARTGVRDRAQAVGYAYRKGIT